MLHRKSSSLLSYSQDAPQFLLPFVKALIKVCWNGEETKEIPKPPLTDSQYDQITKEILINRISCPSKDKLDRKLESFATRFGVCSKALEYYSRLLNQIENPEATLQNLSQENDKKEKDSWDYVWFSCFSFSLTISLACVGTVTS